jgi:hypothetical protein
MSLRCRFLLGVTAWLAFITVLHLWLNLGAFDPDRPPRSSGKRFRIGFLPVT